LAPSALLKMEKLLLTWISDKQAKGDNANSTLIRQKATRIFDDLKEDEENCQVEFSASKDWFDKFKLRTGIHLVVRHGESASADIQAAGSSVSEFARIIEELEGA